MTSMTFGTLRKYISKIDRLSICIEETLEYRNFIIKRDVPDHYNDLFVYGIGMIVSEFYKVGKYEYAASGNREDLVFLPCLEVMLSKEPRDDL